MPPILVGNDVVDLADPRCRGKSRHQRFVARVFAPSEALRIRSAADPDRMLWLLWAAKEACFKVVSKSDAGPPPFVHSAFVVEVGSWARDGAEGSVSFEGRWYPFLAELGPDWAHVICWAGEPAEDSKPPPQLLWRRSLLDDVFPEPSPPDLDALRAARFTERERGAIHSVASAAVRFAAKSGVAEGLGVTTDVLEVVCDGGPLGRTPPRLFEQGRPSATDVSLSHHGRWVAWAAALATGVGGS